MPRKKIALAIAAGVLPVAGFAADSNVTVYGLIDYGYAVRSGNESDGGKLQTQGRNGSLGEFAGGISAGNRIGFKGAEDLGNGLKAIFEIEFGFLGDDTAGVTFNKNRHSWVGLTGGFGTVLGGRIDGARYWFTGKYDPFKNQTVANAASVFGYTSGLGQGDRADNAILYVSPSYQGLSFLAGYVKSLLTQEGTGAAKLGIPPAGVGQDIKQGDTPLYAVAAMYDNGPISATLDYEHLALKKGGVLPEDGEWNIYVAGGSYDFGVGEALGLLRKYQGQEARPGQQEQWLAARRERPPYICAYRDGQLRGRQGQVEWRQQQRLQEVWRRRRVRTVEADGALHDLCADRCGRQRQLRDYACRKHQRRWRNNCRQRRTGKGDEQGVWEVRLRHRDAAQLLILEVNAGVLDGRDRAPVFFAVSNCRYAAVSQADSRASSNSRRPSGNRTKR